MDGTPPPEEDFSSLPLSERLNHRNWKARVNGYESLIKLFQSTASESDPAFRPYISNPDLLKKMVADANAVAQEKAVEVVVQFIKYAGENASGTRESVMPMIVEKCIGSGRSGTKAQALELVLQYVEVSSNGASIITDVLVGLGAKQPKTVVGTVIVLKELVRCFGTNVIPPPPILKALPKMFAHTDKTVRSEAVRLSQQLYRNIGDALDPWLAELKPVQVKELHESFELLDKDGNGKGSFKPERLTRVQQQRHAEDEEADIQENAVEELDPRRFAEETDIVGGIPSGFHAALSSSKWKDRKEALDEVAALLVKTPRIKDHSEIANLCKDLAGRMSDANINCVIVAANSIEALANGLGLNFAKYKDIVIKPMLERLKERKQSVADALGNALDALFPTTSLSDVIEDILPVLGSKNPQVKEGTLKFLNRCLSRSTSPPQPTQIKPMSESLASLLEDSFEGARNEAATGLGILMRIVGERSLNPIMEPMAEVRKVKVKEAFEKATVKCKHGASARKPGPASASLVNPTLKSIEEKVECTTPSHAAPKSPADTLTLSTPPEEPKPKPRGPPIRLLAKKKDPSSVDPPKAVAAAPIKKVVMPQTVSKINKGTKSAAPSALDSFKYRHTPEDAEALAVELIPAQIATNFVDANWKLRLAALEETFEWLSGKITSVDSEILFRYLAKRGWSEKNFQVSAKLYSILRLLAEQCPSFGRPSVALATGHLADKLGDMKLKKSAGELLLLFAEKTSLHFVLTQAYETMERQKAPKVLADSVTWIDQALRDFGISGLSLRTLIEFLKVSLKHSNAAVRSSGTKALVTVKLFAGGDIKDFLEDLNPQLLGTIQSEFDKVDGQSAPTPTRISADLANVTSTDGKGSAGAGVDPLDDLFPRVELDKLLAGSTILNDARSDAWKVRKEALEKLQCILDTGQNKRLRPTMGDIAQVLKARITDTNKACQILALDILSRIALGMNKPFEKHVKHFSAAVASVLADQKANIRAAAIKTLGDIALACEGADPLINGMSSSLDTQNPMLKSSLFSWLSQWLVDHPQQHRIDLSSMLNQIVSCLDDRNADVRKGSQSMLPHLVASLGYDRVVAEANNLKPASRSAIQPVLLAFKPPSSSATALEESGPAQPDPLLALPPMELATNSSAVPVPSTAVGMSSRSGYIRGRKIMGVSSTAVRKEAASSEDSSHIPSKSPSAAAVSYHSQSQSSDLPPCPFIGSNLEIKKTRLMKDMNRWVIEGLPVRKELVEVLHSQMDGRVSPHLLNLLFSSDHNATSDFIVGMSAIVDCYNNASGSSGKTVMGSTKAILLANSDLALKYACVRVHEPQSNLVSKSLDVIEAVVSFLKSCDHQLVDAEAGCFVPTLIHKFGDGREIVRNKSQQLIQSLPRVYAYSRIFALLLEHGLRAKVAKTRQGSLEEVAGILKKAGVGASDPSKSFPVIGKMISDKDANVRKAALNVFSEAYSLLGEKIWGAIGNLPDKDKTQLEERLRRVTGPSMEEQKEVSGFLRQRATQANLRSNSPGKLTGARSASPLPQATAAVTNVSHVPSGKKSYLPSRLARPSSRQTFNKEAAEGVETQERRILRPLNVHAPRQLELPPDPKPSSPKLTPEDRRARAHESNDVGLMISNILSNDPARSVEALKKIQKVLEPVNVPGEPLSQAFQDIAEHSEGLIETIAVQVSHVFDRVNELLDPANFRLAKHLMQTLHSFFSHILLAESLTMDTIMTLLEELTLRLLQTDESSDSSVKEISRFINLIILKVFGSARRISVFRALFVLLLKIVKPFPANKTQSESQNAKVAELVLKCIWKLARNIPADLDKGLLDPIEVFPAIEHSLQSIPPNDWRARASNKIPCGDMPLRTIKVIIQHVVAKYGDGVYDILSNAFDDPSATIVYPYVYRILNSSARNGGLPTEQITSLQGGDVADSSPRTSLEPRPVSRPSSETSQMNGHRVSNGNPSARNSLPTNTNGQPSPLSIDDDPDNQLIAIIHNISSETTGALHKEGITELHRFLKTYPHKKNKVDKLLESTGPAFRKYLARALASRAAEDEDRDAAVADTLSRLEAVRNSSVNSPVQSSPRRSSGSMELSAANAEKLSRLHDLFQYRASDSRSSNELQTSSDPKPEADAS